MRVGRPHGITRHAIQEFLKQPGWQFPGSSRVKSRQLHRIFDDRRISSSDGDKLKCSCAEALGVYGMVRLVSTHIGTYL